MKIFWLKDSKTGHLHKAKGLLRALEERAEIETIEYRVQWRWSGMRTLLQKLGPWTMRLPLHWLFKNVPALSDCDMILSAGGATQWPNAAMAHQHNMANVFLGSPRGMNPDCFSCIAFHDAPNSEPPFFRFTIIPSMVSPQRAILAATQANLPQSPTWGLLLGGDGEGIAWTEEQYRLIVQSLIKAAEQQGASLSIATSRRTPPPIEAMLRELAAASGRLAPSCWYHVRESAAPSLLAMMGSCSRLYVTADSMSMTHEAVSSGRPVFVILPPVGGHARLLNNLSHLQSARHILLQRSTELFDQAASIPEGDWHIIDHDPTAALAQAVLEAHHRHLKKQPATSTHLTT